MPEMSRSVIEGHEIAGLVNPGMAKKIPDFICHALGVHKLGGDAALISVAGDKIDVVVERGEGSLVTPIMVQRQAEVGKAGGDEGTTQVAAIGRGGAGKAFERVDVVTVAEIGEVDTEGLGVGREELLEGFSLHAEDLPGELGLENGLIGVDVGISLGVGAAYVFRTAHGSWGQKAELNAGDGATGDEFGFSVATDRKGSTVHAGAIIHGGVGEDYVFSK